MHLHVALISTSARIDVILHKVSGRRVMELSAARTGARIIRCRQKSTHLREKNIVHPTEKSENAKHFLSSQGRVYVFR